jgi:predicted metal-binding membrane protein
LHLSHEAKVEHARRAPSHWLYMAWPWGLVVVAWSIILLSAPLGWNVLIDHDYLLVTSHLPWLVALAFFLISWQVMLCAMMLPTMFSVLSVVGARGRSRVFARQLFFLSAYALVWTTFALMAFIGDTVLHRLVSHWWWLYTHAWCIGAAVLVLAAVLQLSPLKRKCLMQCRNASTPCSTKSEHTLHDVWLMGLRYGCSCLGSCWAIMLVMFAVGMRNILVIALLAVMLFVEKELPDRRFVSPAIAVAFFASALLWAAFPHI